MTINRHINWDVYRREVAKVADEIPEAAVAVVKHEFSQLVDIAEKEGLNDLLTRIHFDVVSADLREGSKHSNHEFEYWDDSDVETWKGINENLMPAVKVAKELDEDGHDVSWITASDSDRVETEREDGVEAAIQEYNEFHDSAHVFSRNKITFGNEELAVIWMNGITGQISDGAWENAPQTQNGRWKEFCYAEIEVDEGVDGVEAEGGYPNMGFGPNGKLGEYDGLLTRLMYYVRAAGVNDSYSMEQLRNDLRKLNEAF